MWPPCAQGETTIIDNPVPTPQIQTSSRRACASALDRAGDPARGRGLAMALSSCKTAVRDLRLWQSEHDER